MIEKTESEKELLVAAKRDYKALTKDKVRYNSSLHELLVNFSKSNIPDWGSFVFNKQRV